MWPPDPAAYLLRADSIFQPSSLLETVCVTELPASQQVPAAYTSCFFSWGMVLFVFYKAEMVSIFW